MKNIKVIKNYNKKKTLKTLIVEYSKNNIL